jgi:hypothetical protein
LTLPASTCQYQTSNNLERFFENVPPQMLDAE